MSILAEAVAAQEFGRDAQGNLRWPTPGADADAAMAELRASLTPAPSRAPATSAPAAAPVKPTKLTAEPVPEPPVVGQSSPLDRTEIKKKTLLGA
jgi:hypothetical protein